MSARGTSVRGAWRRHVKQLRTVLLFALVSGIALHEVASAGERSLTPSSRAMTFDLPAQSLDMAIERYSEVSGWQIIYDANLADGRRSAPVRGDFAPADALRMLLAGTGLMLERVAPDSAMLVQDPQASQYGQSDPTPPLRSYYGRIQAALKRAFCADSRIRSGAYRIAVGFWIGPSGTVTRAKALGSTGSADIDAAYERAVRSLDLGEPPPAAFEQPIVILATPDLVRQCRAAGLLRAGVER